MILYTKYPLKKYSLTSQEEEVQGRRSRNPSFSKSVNPQSNSNRRGGRRSRTASEGDSWTTVASSDSTQRSAQGQTLYSGRHSSGSMGSSTYINTSSKVNHSAAKMQHPYKVNNLIKIISTNADQTINLSKGILMELLLFCSTRTIKDGQTMSTQQLLVNNILQ